MTTTDEVVRGLMSRCDQAFEAGRANDYRAMIAAVDQLRQLEALCAAKSDALTKAAEVVRRTEGERDRARDLAARLEEELHPPDAA